MLPPQDGHHHLPRLPHWHGRALYPTAAERHVQDEQADGGQEGAVPRTPRRRSCRRVCGARSPEPDTVVRRQDAAGCRGRGPQGRPRRRLRRARVGVDSWRVRARPEAQANGVYRAKKSKRRPTANTLSRVSKAQPSAPSASSSVQTSGQRGLPRASSWGKRLPAALRAVPR